MLVHADNPTPDGFLDPNDEAPAQVLRRLPALSV